MPWLVLNWTLCGAWEESVLGKRGHTTEYIYQAENMKESTQGFPSDSTGGPPTCNGPLMAQGLVFHGCDEAAERWWERTRISVSNAFQNLGSAGGGSSVALTSRF